MRVAALRVAVRLAAFATASCGQPDGYPQCGYPHIPWSPIFAHLKEAWEKRHHPNMLFIFYEDLSKDLAGCLKRMAKFYGKSYSEEQIEELCEHLKFENFKKNDAVNQTKVLEDLGVIDGETTFIRKGKVGGWRDYFQGEMETEVENWMKENLADTDFKFPTFNPHIG